MTEIEIAQMAQLLRKNDQPNSTDEVIKTRYTFF
jgi:hypothetical protein